MNIPFPRKAFAIFFIRMLLVYSHLSSQDEHSETVIIVSGKYLQDFPHSDFFSRSSRIGYILICIVLYLEIRISAVFVAPHSFTLPYKSQFSYYTCQISNNQKLNGFRGSEKSGLLQQKVFPEIVSRRNRMELIVIPGQPETLRNASKGLDCRVKNAFQSFFPTRYFHCNNSIIIHN